MDNSQEKLAREKAREVARAHYTDPVRYPRLDVAVNAAIDAYLAAQGETGAGKWKPIETAPSASEGLNRKVLIIGGSWAEPTIVACDGAWWRMRKREGSAGVPTHWQPLPDPPAITQSALRTLSEESK